MNASDAWSPLVIVASAAYTSVLLVLAVYGTHRSYLLWQRSRLRRRLAELALGVPPLAHDLSVECPFVTVQLPLFNEATVAPRLLSAVARFDYPRDRFEIQVLDDSTDETGNVLQPVIRELREQGYLVHYLRRTQRTGYKAGALAAALTAARGDFIAMFDADFLPPADFLRALVPHFADPKVGMVQARWGHTNRDHSLLTRVAALMLDGHHVIENRVRAAAGWLFNFAGTGGIWRRQAIVDGGGWQHDTLTEDLDLSYRAQLAGWRFVYREDLVLPAELPETLAAFRAQQFRWAKGTVQTRRKLLARLWRSRLSLGARTEAFFHLSPHIAYPLTLLLSCLMPLVVLLIPPMSGLSTFLFDLPLLLGTTGSLAGFYALSQVDQGRRAWDGVRLVPALLMIGVGLAPLLTRALVSGQLAMAGEFVRTPKRGDGPRRYRPTPLEFPWAECMLFLVSSVGVVATITTRHYFAAPFALLFACGYGFMALGMLLRVGEQSEPAELIEPAVSSIPLRTEP